MSSAAVTFRSLPLKSPPAELIFRYRCFMWLLSPAAFETRRIPILHRRLSPATPTSVDTCSERRYFLRLHPAAAGSSWRRLPSCLLPLSPTCVFAPNTRRRLPSIACIRYDIPDSSRLTFLSPRRPPSSAHSSHPNLLVHLRTTSAAYFSVMLANVSHSTCDHGDPM